MIRLEFKGEAAFEANDAAEAWCRNLGISVGQMCRDQPRGLFFGEFLIAKWRSLTTAEQNATDGRITYPFGSPRFGPVEILIADPRIPGEINLSAPLNLARLESLKLAQAELDQLGIGREGVAA